MAAQSRRNPRKRPKDRNQGLALLDNPLVKIGLGRLEDGASHCVL